MQGAPRLLGTGAGESEGSSLIAERAPPGRQRPARGAAAVRRSHAVASYPGDVRDSGDSSYRVRLADVLRRQDVRVLRAFLADNARRFGGLAHIEEVEGQSDEEIEELMHRMIIARPDLSDLHRSSREWLFTHGIDALGESGPRRN